jgi:hypothetical protein
MHEKIEQMEGHQTTSTDKFLTSIKHIKEVCSKYFQKYETDLEEQRIRMDSITKKYDDWSKVLLEPMTLNDARLFSVETRVAEEEDMRVKEYEYLRDLMKKLIYALEQINMVNLTKSGRDSLDVTGTSFLPNLMNAGKD